MSNTISHQTPKKYVLLIPIVLALLVGIYLMLPGRDVNATIYQLAMTDTDGGACYGIRLPSGKLLMIDSGYRGDSVPIAQFIIDQGGTVSDWFITHPHFDHVGGLNAILESGDEEITIERVHYSEFTREFFEEEAEGKDLEVLNTAILLQEFEALFDTVNTEFLPIHRDDVLEIEGITITCMNAFEELVYDVNANSLVLHFDFGKTTFLATGDITDQSIMNMIAHYGESSKLWDVDYVQIPHHGYMAGISSDQLYQLTNPVATFLDCSLNEYKTDAVSIQTHLEMIRQLEIPIILRFEGDNAITLGE